MFILKKIRSATLVETLVASAIIMIVFLIASLSLNNVFRGVVKNNDAQFQNRIKELTYFTKNNKVALPFYEETEQWDIVIETQEGVITMEALHKPSNSKKKKIIDEKR